MSEPGSLDSPDLAVLLPRVRQQLDEFVAGLDAAPADNTGTAFVPAFPPPAENPGELDQLLRTVRDAAGAAVETAGPRYFGYIPAGGLVSSAVGELISRVVNRFTGVADLAPGLVALEDSVLRWLTSVFGLGHGANGILTTGGSQAMLSMVLAAREHHIGTGNLPAGRIYVSEQVHRSVHKAAHIAGFPSAAIRTVPTSDGRHIDPAAAAQAIEDDRAAGLAPFLLVGTAGTTNAGTVDPLDTLASLAAEQGLWFHVDGCYGGFFQLTERGRARLAGIERADSISLDPHKSLFLPYGTGALLARNPALLARAHADADPADYLQDLTETGLPEYADHSTELTREHRGLRLWLPLHLHGVAAFRQALDAKLDLAQYFYDSLQRCPQLELCQPPELSTVVFRLRDGDDDANRALFEAINATGRVFCSSTRLDGRFTLRVCILSFRTRREHVDELLDIIRDALPGTRA